LTVDLDVTPREHDSGYYDHSFRVSKHYRLHYTQSPYYPVWTVVLDRIKRASLLRVVDVGCGAGQFACLLRDHGIGDYTGIDFSPARVAYARKVCPEYRFLAEDVFASEILKTEEYDAVVALEFLEHVERDIDFIRLIRPGTTCIFSVPSFGGSTHVRHFESVAQVSQRYGNHLHAVSVDRILLDPLGATIFVLQGTQISCAAVHDRG